MSKTPGFFDWRILNENYSFKFDQNANYADPDFGLPQGGVDSGKVGYGGENNDWGGSMQRALAFAKIANEFSGKNIISSQKRSRVNTASRKVSDHYMGKKDAYAIDLACRGEAGDKLLAHLMTWFGYPSYTGGYWLNVNKGGYRYQFGWNVKDHFDHIHIGVRKTDAKDTPLTKGQIINSPGQENTRPRIQTSDGDIIYKEERGDPYEYKIINGIWWTKGPEIPEWESLELNKEANDILDSRYGARTPDQIKKNEYTYSAFDRKKSKRGFIERLFKGRGISKYTPGKYTTVYIPDEISGPVSIFVFYPGVKTDGKIGKFYMPELIKKAVPEWYSKYLIVIPNEHSTPWEDVQNDIAEVLSENDLFSKGISVGIFSGSGSDRNSGITEYIKEIKPLNLLLMDPTPGSDLIEAVKELGTQTQTIMMYNPSAWKKYKWYPESIEDLKDAVIATGICEKTSVPHMEIPVALLEKFKKIIEKRA